jgi:hypothetical protein
MFEAPDDKSSYTKKINAPIYEPKNRKPHSIECYDRAKTVRLIEEINSSTLDEAEKQFLREAATRHTVFNYEMIADYYAHSSPAMQHLMEKSALVIIDFDKAIENGYVKLCKDIEQQFREEYPDV